MNYSVSAGDSAPAYLQLYRQIRRDITGGAYQYGEHLPSKRMLAEETGTSVVTTEHAYALLEEEGYVETRPRSGYYVCYRLDDAFPAGSPEPEAPARAVSSGTVPAPDSSAETDRTADAFPFTLFAKTIRKVLNRYDERILIRSPYNGCIELRSALARYLRRGRGIEVSPDQILIGSGAEYLYSLIVQMLGRGRLFALEDPSYGIIRRVYEASGVRTERLAMGPEGIRTDELAKSRASVLHVTPFHSFPSGITATASKRREYIRWAAARNGFLIEDDYDSEFTISTKTEDTLFSLEPDHTVIYLNTFSKTLSPSIRIGYMVLPASRSDLSEKVSFYSCTVPVFDQLVLAEFIDSGDFERHISRVRRALRKRLAKGVEP